MEEHAVAPWDSSRDCMVWNLLTNEKSKPLNISSREHKSRAKPNVIKGSKFIYYCQEGWKTSDNKIYSFSTHHEMRNFLKCDIKLLAKLEEKPRRITIKNPDTKEYDYWQVWRIKKSTTQRLKSWA